MTDEQLEKQISEEFEKWIKGMDFHCQWEADNHLISLDAYFNYVAEVAFKAAALPLMKKIEELEKENKFQADVMRDMGEVVLENKKLKKENEELKLTLKEAIRFINEARWDNNDTPYPKHELIEWNKKFNLDTTTNELLSTTKNSSSDQEGGK